MMMLPKRAVLAYDFSKSMEKLLKRLPGLKRMGIDKISLLHVSDITRSGGHGQISKDKRSERLDSVRKKIEKMDFDDVEKDVFLGFPAEEITTYARKKDAMILSGSHGRGVIKNVFLGGTAYAIIRKAKTPVLVEKVQSESTPENICRKVLLPTDFSKDSRKMLNLLGGSKMPIEEILLLSVIEESESRKELKEKKSDLESKLKKLTERLKERSLSDKIEYKIEKGTASRVISKTAESEDMSLICMPNRGQGGLKEIIIGTTAKEVTRLSPAPVLLFPREFL
ncbi:MAG: universal stress protein [Candidatus Thermoplasmatota archaeon]